MWMQTFKADALQSVDIQVQVRLHVTQSQDLGIENKFRKLK